MISQLYAHQLPADWITAFSEANIYVDEITALSRLPHHFKVFLSTSKSRQFWGEVNGIILNPSEQLRCVLYEEAESEAVEQLLALGLVDWVFPQSGHKSLALTSLGQRIDNRSRRAKLDSDQAQAHSDLAAENEDLAIQLSGRGSALNAARDHIQSQFEAMVGVLGEVIALTPEPLQPHRQEVSTLAVRVGSLMGMGNSELEALSLASQLFDIGKLGMPKTLLSQPFFRMSQADFRVYSLYPLRGSQLLGHYAPLESAAEIVLYHKERPDGGGFPTQNEKGVPLGARILSVVVAFYEYQVGMLTHQPLVAQEALVMLNGLAGTHYERQVVDAFMQCYRDDGASEHAMSERAFLPDQLMCGMRLSRDLLTDTGVLLLPKGVVLSQMHLQQINHLEGCLVYIENAIGDRCDSSQSTETGRRA